MPWTVNAAQCMSISRAGVVVGARAVFQRPDGEATDADPRTSLELVWWRTITGIGVQTPAQFRTMLIGAGTVANPQGEAGAYLAQLNAAADVQVPL